MSFTQKKFIEKSWHLTWHLVDDDGNIFLKLTQYVHDLETYVQK